MIIRTLCCRYTLVMPPDGKWGDPGENGTWTGLMGMLQTRVISFF